jgi:hypothetical protein
MKPPAAVNVERRINAGSTGAAAIHVDMQTMGYKWF